MSHLRLRRPSRWTDVLVARQSPPVGIDPVPQDSASKQSMRLSTSTLVKER